MSEDAVRQQLDELGVEYEIVPCDPALADTAQFCEAYGYAPEDSANTILVIGKSDPPTYVARVVLPRGRAVWVDARVMSGAEIIRGGCSRASKIRAPPDLLLALPSAEGVE